MTVLFFYSEKQSKISVKATINKEISKRSNSIVTVCLAPIVHHSTFIVSAKKKKHLFCSPFIYEMDTALLFFACSKNVASLPTIHLHCEELIDSSYAFLAMQHAHLFHFQIKMMEQTRKRKIKKQANLKTVGHIHRCVWCSNWM